MINYVSQAVCSPRSWPSFQPYSSAQEKDGIDLLYWRFEGKAYDYGMPFVRLWARLR